MCMWSLIGYLHQWMTHFFKMVYSKPYLPLGIIDTTQITPGNSE